MGDIPCEECHGDRYLKNGKFGTTETCHRCHGEGVNKCPHDNIRNGFRGIKMYVKCIECGDEWEVIG